MDGVLLLHYARFMARVTWDERAVNHMLEVHQVTVAEATQAVNDLDAVHYSPDPASKSGLTDRVVGYSRSRRQILVVILLRADGDYEGVNAWPANSTYTRKYREATS